MEVREIKINFLRKWFSLLMVKIMIENLEDILTKAETHRVTLQIIVELYNLQTYMQ